MVSSGMLHLHSLMMEICVPFNTQKMDFVKESLHKANNCAIWWLLYAQPTIYGLQYNAQWIKVGGGHNIYNDKLYLYVI